MPARLTGLKRPRILWVMRLNCLFPNAHLDMSIMTELKPIPRPATSTVHLARWTPEREHGVDADQHLRPSLAGGESVGGFGCGARRVV